VSKVQAEFLERRDDWSSIVLVSGHLALVLVPVFVAAYFGSWTWLLAGYLWFAVTQNGVTNLLHEAAHRLVFRNGRWSDFLGHWILAPFFLTNFELYRRRHWVHHNHAGTEDDTKGTYLVEFNNVVGFLGFVFRCIVGIEAVRRFTTTLKENQLVKPLTKEQVRDGLISIVVFQSVFSGALLALALIGTDGAFLAAVKNSVLAYCLVYLYGMSSGTILLSTLRAIAEHQIVAEVDQTVGKAALRNLAPTAMTRMLFGAYGFCEHGTHHAHPSIPYYNLPTATKTLSQTYVNLHYGPSYWGILAKTIRNEQRKRGNS
jgi:fatty acid desaturase